jgi:hypothetical protein
MFGWGPQAISMAELHGGLDRDFAKPMRLLPRGRIWRGFPDDFVMVDHFPPGK